MHTGIHIEMHMYIRHIFGCRFIYRFTNKHSRHGVTSTTVCASALETALRATSTHKHARGAHLFLLIRASRGLLSSFFCSTFETVPPYLFADMRASRSSPGFIDNRRSLYLFP